MRCSFMLILLVFIAGCSAQTIEIGWVGSLTGDFISSGEAAKAAVELAVEELNEVGGIDGHEVEVIYEDGGCDSEQAKAAAERLVKKGVPVIIGGACSSETFGIADATAASGTVVISYASSNPSITDIGEQVFRTYPSDTNQGFYAAKLTKDANAQRVGILHCESEWCTGLKDVYETEFETMGGEVVATIPYPMATEDLSVEFALLKEYGVDGIYFISYKEAAILGLKQLEAIGWDVKVFGADTWDDPTIAKEAGSAAEGRKFTYVYSPMSDAFKRKLESRGVSPVVGAAQAYDNMHIIAKVMSEGAETPKAIAAALLAMPEYAGESGSISFDENGDLENAVYAIGTFSGGRVVKPK